MFWRNSRSTYGSIRTYWVIFVALNENQYVLQHCYVFNFFNLLVSALALFPTYYLLFLPFLSSILSSVSPHPIPSPARGGEMRTRGFALASWRCCCTVQIVRRYIVLCSTFLDKSLSLGKVQANLTLLSLNRDFHPFCECLGTFSIFIFLNFINFFLSFLFSLPHLFHPTPSPPLHTGAGRCAPTFYSLKRAGTRPAPTTSGGDAHRPFTLASWRYCCTELLAFGDAHRPFVP